MERIDEASRRLPEFTASAVPIVLADNQTWHFPKPWTELRPRFNSLRPIGLWAATTHGDEFDLAIEALREEEASDTDVIIGILTLGAILLSKNYDLSDDELESLFVFRFDNPETNERSMAMIRQIADVAMGLNSPKDFARWRRLTMLANGLTQPMLLEDEIDICDMLEAIGRTVSAHTWVAECINQRRSRSNEGLM